MTRETLAMTREDSDSDWWLATRLRTRPLKKQWLETWHMWLGTRLETRQSWLVHSSGSTTPRLVVIWELVGDVVCEDCLSVSACIFHHFQFPNSWELANPIPWILELKMIKNPGRPGMNALVLCIFSIFIKEVIEWLACGFKLFFFRSLVSYFNIIRCTQWHLFDVCGRRGVHPFIPVAESVQFD